MRCGALRAAVVSGGVGVLLSDVLLAGWCLLQVVVHMLSSLAAVQLLQTSWVTGGGGGFSLLQCIVSVMGPNHSGGFPAADSGLLSSFSFPPLLQIFFLAGHESPEPERALHSRSPASTSSYPSMLLCHLSFTVPMNH